MRVTILCILSVLLWSACTIAQLQDTPDSANLGKTKEQLEKILSENIIPFWYPEVIDLENGGYRLNHDEEGKWLGPNNKALVTQARTLWFFSRLYNSGYGKEDYLKAAQHGFKFLHERMWDSESGGFFWEVDSKGESPTKPHKHLYGQAFGLYALAEYIKASKDEEAIKLARQLFSLIEFHAHDQVYGGYKEFFTREWGAPPEDTITYIGSKPGTKLMNTHMHLMEAFTSYYEVSKDPLVRERLFELTLILSNATVRKTVGGCTDGYKRDWTPLHGGYSERISYGHTMENVWLLVEVCNTIGISNGPLLDLYRTLLDYSLKYGFDYKEGGFYESGPFREPADSQGKIWWPQAEGLVATLYMYRLTGEEKYFKAFEKTLDWVNGHQVDWKHGDWHSWVGPDGTTGGSKSGPWKSPYHNGRAVLKCLELISSF